MDGDKALVLFSGGQDSATCLAWALNRFSFVETIGFNYRQRHKIELEVRKQFLAELRQTFPEWDKKLGEDTVVDVGGLADISETALTKDVEISMQENGLPNTFVPGRNIIFFTFAGGVAYRRGCKQIVAGVCETDFSGYPDCRDDTVKAVQIALNLGMEARFVTHTPLMWIDKAATWKLALELGKDRLIDLITEHTHTCYMGDRSIRHNWGYGCGECPACDLRKTGWETFSNRPNFEGGV